jgi:parallel beta-helix repeat protein
MRTALLASAALVAGIGSAVAQVTIAPGQSIQAAVAAAPAGTTFNLGAGTYSGAPFSPKSGDSFIGAANGGTVFNGAGQSSPMVNGGASNVTFQNVTTTGFNTPAQVAPIQTASGWKLINVTSTNNAGAGLYLSGRGVLVQGGSFSNNGQVGIDGSFANGSTVKDATISGNNTAGYDTGWDAGGIKVTNTANLTVTGNTVQNNTGNGIWADISSSNWTITDNGVAGNTGNGIMYEISHGATISNNLVANNQGSAVYVSNSDGVTATGNGIVVPPGNTMTGAAIGGGVVIWDNSGRGNDPNTGQPYLSNNDSATGNTIVGSQSTSGVFSVLGTPSNDTFANNVFQAAGAAGTAAAQAAVTAAQAAYNAASQAAGAIEKSVGTALNALSAPVSTAPQTSSPAADAQSSTPEESAPTQESTPAPTVPQQPAPVMVTAPALNPGPLSVAQVAALAASGGIDPSTGPSMPATPTGCPTWGAN